MFSAEFNLRAWQSCRDVDHASQRNLRGDFTEIDVVWFWTLWHEKERKKVLVMRQSGDVSRAGGVFFCFPPWRGTSCVPCLLAEPARGGWCWMQVQITPPPTLPVWLQSALITSMDCVWLSSFFSYTIPPPLPAPSRSCTQPSLHRHLGIRQQTNWPTCVWNFKKPCCTPALGTIFCCRSVNTPHYQLHASGSS